MEYTLHLHALKRQRFHFLNIFNFSSLVLITIYLVCLYVPGFVFMLITIFVCFQFFPSALSSFNYLFYLFIFLMDIIFALINPF